MSWIVAYVNVKTKEEALENVEKAIKAYLKVTEKPTKGIKPFLLRAQIRRAGLTEKEYLELL